jgi:hypothetical protein
VLGRLGLDGVRGGGGPDREAVWFMSQIEAKRREHAQRFNGARFYGSWPPKDDDQKKKHALILHEEFHHDKKCHLGLSGRAGKGTTLRRCRFDGVFVQIAKGGSFFCLVFFFSRQNFLAPFLWVFCRSD